MTYVWDFGDGGRAGGRTATHTYTTPGTYDAKVTVTDPHNATGTATVRVTVGPVAGGLGGVRGAQAALTLPKSVKAFGARGLKVRVSCAAGGRAKATLKVTGAVAKRLSLARRTIASRSLRCRAGKAVTLRLKPKRAVARRLARTRTLRMALRVSAPGAKALERRVTIK
jgi:hypothetical protein